MPALLALVLAFSGCKSEPAKVPASKPVVAAGMAIVRGKVTFEGTPPARATLGDQICGVTKQPIKDESVLVSATGAMENVVVYLEDGPNVESKTEPALLDQQYCRYVPHVVAVRTGHTLKVKSSDPTLHNAHSDKGTNKPFNLSFADAGQTRDVTFAVPEVAIRVRCDVHQWMNAYVAVFDHPFFAVTGEDGQFELKGVPAGTYTLVAWHERYGQKKTPVTVGTDGTATAGFVFGK
ncbi:carboxypeptidase regulatory-like domain-containing protein [Humisphaera borealis]|uniref:Rhamnogalacturonan lyase domain-containing protein n=1 Tax=Humisphaera borealis TaxID=2807512 RepID=A0A7M2X0P4_9BACT|nr:carboxypeptidase regulatory-like domain-containing protein [Humisphaera borealis]QOV91317.1 hypothetical protein IPV69_08165 [Humisphaera borealis]